MMNGSKKQQQSIARGGATTGIFSLSSTSAATMPLPPGDSDHKLNSTLSTVNLILIMCTFFGVGVIGGFVMFFSLWQTECRDLLSRQQVHHERAYRSLEREQDVWKWSQLQQARTATNDQHLSCKAQQQGEESKAVSAISTRMEGMMAKHHDLLDQHETAMRTLLDRERDIANAEQHQQVLHRENERLQVEMGVITMQLEKIKQQSTRQEQSLKSQLLLAQSMVQQKIDEVEALRSATAGSQSAVSSSSASSASHGDCTASLLQYDRQLSKFQSALRRKSSAQAIMLFGPAPYHVQLTLQVPRELVGIVADSDSILVLIEFASLQDMPYTIWTFLSMVDLGLYTGTTLEWLPPGGNLLPRRTGMDPAAAAAAATIISTQNSVFMGGHPVDPTGNNNNSNKKLQSKLLRAYAEYGFDVDQPLMFKEISPLHPCDQPYAFGFVRQGPELVLSLPSSLDLDTTVDSGVDNTLTPNHVAAGMVPVSSSSLSETTATAWQYSCPGQVIRGRELLSRLAQAYQQQQQQQQSGGEKHKRQQQQKQRQQSLPRLIIQNVNIVRHSVATSLGTDHGKA